MEKSPPPPDEGRKSRSDGVQSRERLLMTAMRLFAEQGFAKTSTREIALAAGTNIASISYYFGDKAGLYRAAFTEPAPHRTEDIEAFTREDLSLREALREFYSHLLEPLKQGDLARMCMRLWFREMLEPTGLWHEEIDSDIRPAHAGLTQVIARHMQLTAIDDDLSRLSFCIVGMALQLMIARDVIDKISPQLLDSESAIDTWLERLVDYGEALVHAEQARRAALPTSPAAPVTPP
ncbi:CerR family C-terminal domain-containing protein [Massilia sp. CF038]|uniref:CerR family C-terminal domain-containing protein n=1 Tax=Massilia sp. CF038 TaxID=1881045 RepID=UPI0009233120|nr:CerR family C-terminal domain-containing protein [Massilia sp. CF038]SHG40758.1 transcriptional regulator, TetR family [Massilia sp. CF038]